MIKELRKLDKTDRAKSNYIRGLQARGRIKQIISLKGYVCYDTEELAKFKASAKRGRPPKIREYKGEK